MALHITFKSGARQAVTAGRYFQEEANALVNTILLTAAPRNYFVDPGHGPSIPFRFWSSTLLSDEHLSALALLVDRSLDEVARLAQHPDRAGLQEAFVRWARVPWPASSFFLERLGTQGPFSATEHVRGSFAVVGGQLVLLSAPRFILYQLDPGLFGVAVADRGSFLLEQRSGEHETHLQEHGN